MMTASTPASMVSDSAAAYKHRSRSHRRHSKLHSSTKMKAAFILLATVANIAAGAGTYETELLRGIDIYNHRSKCWGKKNVDMYAAQMEKAKRECMQMEPMFDFPAMARESRTPSFAPTTTPSRS